MPLDIPATEPDNLAVVRRTVAAFNRCSLDEALGLSHPDVELVTPLFEIWRTERTGHDRVREWFARVEYEWAFLELYDLDLEDAGEWVTGRMRARGRGKASRNELDWELHLAARVVNGRLSTFSLHLSRKRALRAIAAARRATCER